MNSLLRIPSNLVTNQELKKSSRTEKKHTHTHEETKTNQKNFFRKPADINNFPSSLETTQIERKEKEKEEDEKPL